MALPGRRHSGHRRVPVDLRGRRGECGVIDEFLDSVRAGVGRAMVVRGEPGAGKTALQEYLTEHASGCRLARAAGVVWVLGAVVFIYFWPWITVNGFRRIFVKHGLGGGPIPVDTPYAVPDSPSHSASTGSVLATGTDDILYLGGWLDVKVGPRVLHVPDLDHPKRRLTDAGRQRLHRHLHP